MREREVCGFGWRHSGCYGASVDSACTPSTNLQSSGIGQGVDNFFWLGVGRWRLQVAVILSTVRESQYRLLYKNMLLQSLVLNIWGVGADYSKI